MTNTIRVRIAVAVTPNGCWNAVGSKLSPTYTQPDADAAKHAGLFVFGSEGRGHVVFVEADVPVPSAMPTVPDVQADRVDAPLPSLTELAADAARVAGGLHAAALSAGASL